MSAFTESTVEDAALAWLEAVNWRISHGADIAPDMPAAERRDYSEVVLAQRLRGALARLNPALPAEALEDAFRKLSRLEGANLVARNRQLHRFIVDGVTVQYRHPDGRIAGAQARVIDFDEPDNNDWLAVNQFTVSENKRTRRADIVLFVNGLPLAIFELKNPADEHATIWSAYDQLQTYKHEIPSLFDYNAALVITDGTQARIGTITSERERFMPWRTVTGETLAGGEVSELQVLLAGALDQRRFLDLLRYFTVFEDDGRGQVSKKMAGYHQFHAVNVAIEETIRAAVPREGRARDPGRYESRRQAGGKRGDQRVGVVWHTQGSGKSLTMAFYAGRVILHREMENPTIVVITDRNDLDDQLFGTFARCQELLRQPPEQAESRADLRAKLDQREAGGVIFTTIQKFMPDAKGEANPALSERRNIVVIADEAHRSQYDFIDGLAKHLHDALPRASYIAFTGTPLELEDKNTRAVFGDYISIYDIQRAVEDHATVPIYYEGRLAKLALDEAERPRIDPEFEEVTEGEEVERKEALKSRWAQLEALAGTEKRLKLIARDLVAHWGPRVEAMEPLAPGGKAMIVGMSRRICVALYQEVVALRPDWHHGDDEKGALKVVMTGSASDPVDWQQHIRNKGAREALAHRFRDPADPFKIVIVRDMWLTGFDAPSLHTMYVDKPMRGHGLMQSIARVNRVFKGKQGGLVVDYIGLAEELRKALATYTESKGEGQITLDQEQAVTVMLEKYEVCHDLFHGFDRSSWLSGKPEVRLSLLPAAQEHVLALEDGRERFDQAARALTSAFSLAVPHARALEIRDEVGFFQAVRAGLAKSARGERKTDEELDFAIRQILSRAVSSDEVIDIFKVAGLKKPDISILDEGFLAEVKGMPHRNLAVELLRKLLQEEIKTTSRTNVVQARSFAELLEQSIRRYQNRAIETAQVIEELIELAREMRGARDRGQELGLDEAEIAFYDALETNDSAVKVLGDAVLKQIAVELADSVRKNVTIDWTVRENVRAKMRVIVRRILRKHGYPPDKQEKATLLVLEQAEVLSEQWAEAA